MRAFCLLSFGLLLTASGSITSGQEIAGELPKGAEADPGDTSRNESGARRLEGRHARLPLPGDDSKKGVNNGRMRNYYVPAELRVGGVGGFGGGFGGDKLDATFNTKVFWIVCRVNNCQYCLGHQESKLASSGVSEDTIAALDFDWSEFSDRERLAFGLARKLTFEPHLINRADIEPLKKHYTDLQILNLISSIAGFNAMNRWTDGLAIPQEKGRNFSHRSRRNSDKRSLVALLTDDKGHLPANALRPGTPTRAEIDKASANVVDARHGSTWHPMQRPASSCRRDQPTLLCPIGCGCSPSPRAAKGESKARRPCKPKATWNPSCVPRSFGSPRCTTALVFTRSGRKAVA